MRCPKYREELAEPLAKSKIRSHTVGDMGL